jgi:hypothetical protein
VTLLRASSQPQTNATSVTSQPAPQSNSSAYNAVQSTPPRNSTVITANNVTGNSIEALDNKGSSIWEQREPFGDFEQAFTEAVK